MKVGITYDLKEQYGFEKLDLRYTDFHKTEDVEFVKSMISKITGSVTLIGNSSDLLDYINKRNDIDLVFNMSWGFKGRNREGLIPAILESHGIKYT